MRALCGHDSKITCKIESRSGLIKLESILNEADQILIDRGDLSRQIPVEKIPFLQRQIIFAAKRARKPVYVAMNLLEIMVVHEVPSSVEVNDVVSTLQMGADGLVLAAETTIGNFLGQAVEMIRRIIEENELWGSKSTIEEINGF